MNSRNLEKVVFVVSLALLAFLYGFATQTFDWPPSGFLERAWLQAGNVEVDQEGTPRFASPIVYDREGARTVGPTEEVEPGLTLVATWWEDFGWTQGLKLIDRTGRIVHRWRIDGDGVFPDPSDEHGRRAPDRTSIHGLHLFPDGDVLVNISYVGTARIDACGQVVWRRASGAHHSIARADDGSFWVTAGTFETHAGSTDRYQGFDPEYRP